MFLLRSSKATLHNAAQRCMNAANRSNGSARLFRCNAPVALSVAPAALAQSFFETAAALRLKRSRNLSAALFVML